jgi:hypothetical protein
LRVLIACNEDDVQPYVGTLCQSLRDIGVTVDSGLNRFWIPHDEYDIVHLQWPEALFQWRNPVWSDLWTLFHDVLPEWRASARIVITRHNAAPHDKFNPYWRSLYDHIYGYVDGVVHLGDYGISNFSSDVGSTVRWQATIPHHIFRAYGELVGMPTARKILSIPEKKKVVLVFGSLRNNEERQLLLDAFTNLSIKKKLLLVPNFGSPIRPPRRNPIKWLAWELNHHEFILPRQLRLGRSPVPDDWVKFYFSAADVVLIPRIDTLNSGVVPLAFQFAKVVTGPNVGNIGLILRASGNPTFDPTSALDCARSLEVALEMKDNGLADRNKSLATDRWSYDRIAKMHLDFYEKMLN